MNCALEARVAPSKEDPTHQFQVNAENTDCVRQNRLVTRSDKSSSSDFLHASSIYKILYAIKVSKVFQIVNMENEPWLLLFHCRMTYTHSPPLATSQWEMYEATPYCLHWLHMAASSIAHVSDELHTRTCWTQYAGLEKSLTSDFCVDDVIHSS